MPTLSALLLLIFAGTLAAVLSALETAISSLKEHHFEHLRQSREKPRVARAVAFVQESPQTHLLATLIFSAFTNLSLAVIIIYLILEHASAWGTREWPLAVAFVAGLIALVDIVPKTIALSHPKDTLRRSSWLLLLFQPWLTPFARFLEKVSDAVVDWIAPAKLQSRAVVTEDEIGTWIEMRRNLGTLDDAESDIIQDIVRLGSKTAKDCLTPRVDVFALPHDLSPDEARKQITSQNHWKIPVYKDVSDSVVNVLDVKSYLLDGPDANYQDHLDPPIFVPETMNAVDLFKSYLTSPHSMAIVLDEYGGLEGVVTHTDIVEEIISDAAPHFDHAPQIQNLGHDRLLVTGAARLDEMSEMLGIDLEEDGIDTIGGLVFNTLIQIPEPGTRVGLEGAIATVRRCSKNRIQELIIEKSHLHSVADEDPDEPADDTEPRRRGA